MDTPALYPSFSLNTSVSTLCYSYDMTSSDDGVLTASGSEGQPQGLLMTYTVLEVNLIAIGLRWILHYVEQGYSDEWYIQAKQTWVEYYHLVEDNQDDACKPIWSNEVELTITPLIHNILTETLRLHYSRYSPTEQAVAAIMMSRLADLELAIYVAEA